MEWLSPWMIAGAVLCALLLAVLFFPFIFKIRFEASLKGIEARLSIFKKQLYKYEKKFSKEPESTDADGFDSRPDNEEAVVPTYVPPKKKVEPAEAKPKVETKPEVESRAPESPKEKLEGKPVEKVEPVESAEEPKKTEALQQSAETYVPQQPPEIPQPIDTRVKIGGENEKEASPEKNAESSEKKEDAAEKKKEKQPKRSLTETEFWTIILTPDFDRIAFWAVKKWLVCLLKLFRVKFNDCFVEGIRSDVLTMGYGAALNGILKGYPYVKDWDIRMDWTGDHELRAAGLIDASVNLCRAIGIIIATFFYGGVIAFQFWRRRVHVLKTNELPELGWIRTKIVKQLAEE